MQDKKLLELLENFVIKLDNGELNEYIWNNYIHGEIQIVIQERE